MAKIAFILEDLFEDSEFRIPYDRLRSAGHTVVVVGSEAKKEVEGKREKEKVRIEQSVAEVSPEDFDALVIPGGYSPDRLRTDPRMVELTRSIYIAGKPVAAICHGPWMLAEAEILDGRTVTSWPSIKTDLIHAGAKWVDREVVEDGNLITSRKPDDLSAFTDAVLHQLEHGPRERPSIPEVPGASVHPPLV
jgi:protease I